MFEAASNGAKQAGKSVGALIIMVIAFVSIYYFVDSTLSWMGSRVGLDTSLSVSFLQQENRQKRVQVVSH